MVTLIDTVNRKTPSSVNEAPTVGDKTHVLNFVELVMIFRLFGFFFLKNDLQKKPVHSNFLSRKHTIFRRDILSWAIHPAQR
jgi:hypothetical protein